VLYGCLAASAFISVVEMPKGLERAAARLTSCAHNDW
jgi:hypothetical protein